MYKRNHLNCGRPSKHTLSFFCSPINALLVYFIAVISKSINPHSTHHKSAIQVAESEIITQMLVVDSGFGLESFCCYRR
jgi:hypothetical protein